MLDIYFEENYGKLYEEHEQGISEVFEYESSNGTVRTVFIKREIPTLVEGEKYYDIVTPYGYGGPVITKLTDGASKEDLVKEFMAEFNTYCLENNIVSEFVRFHPILENALDFKSVYDATFLRRTVGTTIRPDEDPLAAEFSRRTRKTVRRSVREGLTYKIERKPENIDDFYEIYYSTMDRNKAGEYYYFEKDYFENLLKHFRENIIIAKVFYKGKIIAMSLNFVY